MREGSSSHGIRSGSFNHALSHGSIGTPAINQRFGLRVSDPSTKGAVIDHYASIIWAVDGPLARWMADFHNISAGGIAPILEKAILSRAEQEIFKKFANYIMGGPQGISERVRYILTLTALKYYQEVKEECGPGGDPGISRIDQALITFSISEQMFTQWQRSIRDHFNAENAAGMSAHQIGGQPQVDVLTTMNNTLTLMQRQLDRQGDAVHTMYDNVSALTIKNEKSWVELPTQVSQALSTALLKRRSDWGAVAGIVSSSTSSSGAGTSSSSNSGVEDQGEETDGTKKKKLKYACRLTSWRTTPSTIVPTPAGGVNVVPGSLGANLLLTIADLQLSAFLFQWYKYGLYNCSISVVDKQQMSKTDKDNMTRFSWLIAVCKRFMPANFSLTAPPHSLTSNQHSDMQWDIALSDMSKDVEDKIMRFRNTYVPQTRRAKQPKIFSTIIALRNRAIFPIDVFPSLPEGLTDSTVDTTDGLFHWYVRDQDIFKTK